MPLLYYRLKHPISLRRSHRVSQVNIPYQCVACDDLRPRGVTELSPIDFNAVAFCLTDNIGLPNLNFFGAQSLKLKAYRLLPNCLRLTFTITHKCPKLAMSSLLDLLQWKSHPLYDTFLSWRTGNELPSFAVT